MKKEKSAAASQGENIQPKDELASYKKQLSDLKDFKSLLVKDQKEQYGNLVISSEDENRMYYEHVEEEVRAVMNAERHSSITHLRLDDTIAKTILEYGLKKTTKEDDTEENGVSVKDFNKKKAKSISPGSDGDQYYYKGVNRIIVLKKFARSLVYDRKKRGRGKLSSLDVEKLEKLIDELGRELESPEVDEIEKAKEEASYVTEYKQLGCEYSKGDKVLIARIGSLVSALSVFLDNIDDKSLYDSVKDIIEAIQVAVYDPEISSDENIDIKKRFDFNVGIVDHLLRSLKRKTRERVDLKELESSPKTVFSALESVSYLLEALNGPERTDWEGKTLNKAGGEEKLGDAEHFILACSAQKADSTEVIANASVADYLQKMLEGEKSALNNVKYLNDEEFAKLCVEQKKLRKKSPEGLEAKIEARMRNGQTHYSNCKNPEVWKKAEALLSTKRKDGKNNSESFNGVVAALKDLYEIKDSYDYSEIAKRGNVFVKAAKSYIGRWFTGWTGIGPVRTRLIKGILGELGEEGYSGYIENIDVKTAEDNYSPKLDEEGKQNLWKKNENDIAILQEAAHLRQEEKDWAKAKRAAGKKAAEKKTADEKAVKKADEKKAVEKKVVENELKVPRLNEIPSSKNAAVKINGNMINVNQDVKVQFSASKDASNCVNKMIELSDRLKTNGYKAVKEDYEAFVFIEDEANKLLKEKEVKERQQNALKFKDSFSKASQEAGKKLIESSEFQLDKNSEAVLKLYQKLLDDILKIKPDATELRDAFEEFLWQNRLLVIHKQLIPLNSIGRRLSSIAQDFIAKIKDIMKSKKYNQANEIQAIINSMVNFNERWRKINVVRKPADIQQNQ